MAAGLACAIASRAQAAPPPGGRLAFQIWRGGHRIGTHNLDFRGDGQNFSVHIEVVMAVSLGPIPLFRYHHQAIETWRGGGFAELTSRSVTNGRAEQVVATRGPGGVIVRTAGGLHILAADAVPLTHWNERGLTSPLFNPQTGLPMRELVSRQPGPIPGDPAARGTRYTLAGDADIIDWYDAAGVWAALKGKAEDGSFIDYRRVG